jgi:hypothetical protein
MDEIKNNVHYSNSADIGMGIYDIRIIFKNKISNDESVDEVAIMMSPQHAKKISEIMVQIISEYEEKYGPIPVETEENME